MSLNVKIVSRALGSLRSGDHVCRSCRRSLQRRYASVATAQASVETPPITQMSPNKPAAFPLPQPKYYIKAGVVLSRPPIVTPDLHPFEKAYMLYQRRLNERLVLPFTQYFYYKRGTPSFEHWRTKRRERGGVAARDIGNYNAYTEESWNDEVLQGSKDADPETIVKALIDEEGRASDFVTEGGDTGMAGLRRTTDADEKKDMKSLERSLSRTLYLLVKRTAESDATRPSMWSFPCATVEEREGVKEVGLNFPTTGVTY